MAHRSDECHSRELNFIVRRLEKLSERCAQTYHRVCLLGVLCHRHFPLAAALHSEVLPAFRSRTGRVEQNWASQDLCDRHEPRISPNHLQRLG